MTRANPITVVPIFAGLLLSACVSFGGKPPKMLLILAPDTQLAADSAHSSSEGTTIVVLTPGAPAMLLNNRIAVRTNGTDISYVKGSNWADMPPKLFADLVSETIAAKTKRVVIDRRQYAAAPGERLSGQLTEFYFDSTARQAVVRYDAMLIPGDGKPISTRRFEAVEPVAKDDAATIARSLNRAANRVAAQVAEWVDKPSA